RRGADDGGSAAGAETVIVALRAVRASVLGPPGRMWYPSSNLCPGDALMMNVIVDPALSAEPLLAKAIKHATALLEQQASSHDSPVTAEWRARAEDSSEVELALSDEYGAAGLGRISRSDLLTGDDRWIRWDLNQVWHRLRGQRLDYHLALVRQA